MKKLLLMSAAMLTAVADNDACDNSTRQVGEISYANSQVIFPRPGKIVNSTTKRIIGIVKDSNNKPVKNVEVEVSINGKAWGTATTNKFGVWTYKLRPSLKFTEGKHTVSACDTVNHIALKSSSFTVKNKVKKRDCLVDTTNSCIAYPADQTYINVTQPTIVGYLADVNDNDLANVQAVLSVNSNTVGTVNSDDNGIFAYDLTSTQALTPDGSYTIGAVTCVSPTVTLNTATVIVDTVAPAAPVITGVSVSDNTATINGTTEPYGAIATYIDNSSDAQYAYADQYGNWSIDYFLVSGSHSIQANATDLAGNTGSLCSPYNFTV